MKRWFLIAFVLLATEAPIFGCSCVGKDLSLETKVEGANFIFKGSVRSQDSIRIEEEVLEDYYLIRYEFELEKVYKNNILDSLANTEIIVLYSHSESNACGFFYSVGNTYIAFAELLSFERPYLSMEHRALTSNKCKTNELFNSKLEERIIQTIKN